ncbi:hypothetical protein OPV22_026693 [Ensete ventricosum]|uniref:Uncharacterized protein n=1 Tax=Ensete ventricosum TaxID=4639 RepID=A0AAV8PVG4_ENSVE|nr:hypothetical protein OPV22_026693 [Ensete ventricosum]
MRGRECQLMGLTWLLSKNRTTTLPAHRHLRPPGAHGGRGCRRRILPGPTFLPLLPASVASQSSIMSSLYNDDGVKPLRLRRLERAASRIFSSEIGERGEKVNRESKGIGVTSP